MCCCCWPVILVIGVLVVAGSFPFPASSSSTVPLLLACHCCQMLAPVIHPVSSCSQGWGWVLGHSPCPIMLVASVVVVVPTWLLPSPPCEQGLVVVWWVLSWLCHLVVIVVSSSSYLKNLVSNKIMKSERERLTNGPRDIKKCPLGLFCLLHLLLTVPPTAPHCSVSLLLHCHSAWPIGSITTVSLFCTHSQPTSRCSWQWFLVLGWWLCLSLLCFYGGSLIVR